MEEIPILLRGFEKTEPLQLIEGVNTDQDLFEKLSAIVDIPLVDAATFNRATMRLERFVINDVSFLVQVPIDYPSLTDDEKRQIKYQFGNIYQSTDGKLKEIAGQLMERLNLQVMTIQPSDSPAPKLILIDLEQGKFESFVQQTQQYQRWYMKAIEVLTSDLEDLKTELQSDIKQLFAGNDISNNRFLKWLFFDELNAGIKFNMKIVDYENGLPLIATQLRVDLSAIHFTPSLAESHIFKYCSIRRKTIEAARQPYLSEEASKPPPKPKNLYNAKIKAIFFESAISKVDDKILNYPYENNNKKYTAYANALQKHFGLIVTAGTLENNYKGMDKLSEKIKSLNKTENDKLRKLFKRFGFDDLALKVAKTSDYSQS